MIPKPTEDTVTNLLIEELERYGVKAESFPLISTPSGVRKPTFGARMRECILLKLNLRNRI